MAPLHRVGDPGVLVDGHENNGAGGDGHRVAVAGDVVVDGHGGWPAAPRRLGQLHAVGVSGAGRVRVLVEPQAYRHRLLLSPLWDVLAADIPADDVFVLVVLAEFQVQVAHGQHEPVGVFLQLPREGQLEASFGGSLTGMDAQLLHRVGISFPSEVGLSEHAYVSVVSNAPVAQEVLVLGSFHRQRGIPQAVRVVLSVGACQHPVVGEVDVYLAAPDPLGELDAGVKLYYDSVHFRFDPGPAVDEPDLVAGVLPGRPGDRLHRRGAAFRRSLGPGRGRAAQGGARQGQYDGYAGGQRRPGHGSLPGWSVGSWLLVRLVPFHLYRVSPASFNSRRRWLLWLSGVASALCGLFLECYSSNK